MAFTVAWCGEGRGENMKSFLLRRQYVVSLPGAVWSMLLVGVKQLHWLEWSSDELPQVRIRSFGSINPWIQRESWLMNAKLY